jgi:hypothetical protein
VGPAGEQQPCQSDAQAEVHDKIDCRREIALTIRTGVPDLIGGRIAQGDRCGQQCEQHDGDHHVKPARPFRMYRRWFAAIQLRYCAMSDHVSIQLHGDSSRCLLHGCRTYAQFEA